MSAVDLLVVIVSYCTRDMTVACVDSVLRECEHLGRPYRVVVVDNASPDGTAAAIAARPHPRLTLLANARNVGYGAACNQGAAVDGAARHVLLLNADTRAEPGAIATLVDVLDRDPLVALAGPSITGEDGTRRETIRGHPTPLALLHRHTVLRFVRVGARAYRRYRQPPGEAGPDGLTDAEVVNGAVMAVRGESFRAAGGFDPRYFLYFEEADLCRRLAQAGGRIVCAPAAVFRHEGGASAETDSERALVWYLQSLLLYVDRFHGRRRGLAFRAVFKPLFLLRMGTDAVRDLAAWAFRPRRRPVKRRELRLAVRFLTRGMWVFLGS